MAKLVTNIQPGPKGFVLGKAVVKHYQGEGLPTKITWDPAWIRETETGADVIWIQRKGDYNGLFTRYPEGAFIIESV